MSIQDVPGYIVVGERESIYPLNTPTNWLSICLPWFPFACGYLFPQNSMRDAQNLMRGVYVVEVDTIHA
jgi:hypothetical protein